MAINPLSVEPQAAVSAFDFSPLERLTSFAPPQQGENAKLAELAKQYGVGQQPPFGQPPPSATSADFAATAKPIPYAPAGGGGTGGNVQSWYDFARRPLSEGGLGLTPEQAAGKVANLQAESGKNIASWGVTGDNGTAFGAAQWRGDRFNNLKRFATERGLDYRTTEAQQGFMRHEYLNNESKAYSALTSAQTPEQAATAVNRFYERSADRSGTREATALRLLRLLGGR